MIENRNFENDNGETINVSEIKLEPTQNDSNPPPSPAVKKKRTIFQKTYHKLRNNPHLVRRIVSILIHVAVVVYFGYATYYFLESEKDTEFKIDDDERCHGKCGLQWCNGYGMLLIVLGLTYVGMFYYFFFKPKVGKVLHREVIKPAKRKAKKKLNNKFSFIIAGIVIIGSLILFLYFETRDSPDRLNSIVAPIFFICTGYIFSTDRKAIKWRPVILGIIFQFLLGLICIRWEIGRNIFQCIGDKVATFLSYAKDGSDFIFSEELVEKGIFAFAVLPVIFFFSFFISILYYLGTMQWIISKLGWILQSLLGTTVCESVNSAGNIFLGMTESPLLIRPYIQYLTSSEIHSIMVSGFATVSGTVLAAYMSYGAEPAHLITSTVMAAPAALGLSKLYFPETEESKTKSENIKLEKSADTSILDAASKGATIAIEIILGIIANLVAFVSFISFLNGVVNWLGYLIGEDEISFEWLFAKIFIPLSWSLGVQWEDCDLVAKVIATKTIINEFVAYKRLGEYKKANLISPRSAGIATFAICGFSNPSSLGIFIGILGAMAPNQRPVIARVAMRAFIVGSIVCFISASFAGLLMPETNFDEFPVTNTTNAGKFLMNSTFT